MIKLLKKYQVQLTPFTATKEWELSNADNESLLLYEKAGDPNDGVPYALEYIDYGNGSNLPSQNSGCDIALEQQSNDLATSEQGLNVQGLFYPDTDPTNNDGTYKRSIYHQVQTMFYNKFNNPIEIWGSEVLDADLSKTKRIITDEFQLIDIPRNVYGDKILPNSVTIYNNDLDDPYTIMDDGHCNLFAGTNLFSKHQELGEYSNSFDATQSSSYCGYYFGTNIPTHSFFDSAKLTIGFLYGSTQNYPYYEYPKIGISFYSGSPLITTFTSSVNDYPSISMSFSGGYVTSNVTTITSSFDTESVNVAFYSGSYDLTVLVVTASFESSSVSMSFYTGSYLLTTFPLPLILESSSVTVGFSYGSIV